MKLQLSLTVSTCLFLIAGCNSSVTHNSPAELAVFEVFPSAETKTHLKDTPQNIDADDPAIWVNKESPKDSIVAATLKRGGMDIYDMRGKLLQHIPPTPAPACEGLTVGQTCNNKGGRWNNVDVIYDFNINGKLSDLFIASDRGTDRLDVFLINKKPVNGSFVTNISSKNNSPMIFSKNQDEVNLGDTSYGLAAVTTDKAHVYVTQSNKPNIADVTLFVDENNSVGYKVIQKLTFPSKFLLPNNKIWQACTDDDGEYPHFEGIVADKAHNALYFAQEDIGIWKVKLDQPDDVLSWNLFAKVNSFGVPYTRKWSAKDEEYICTLDPQSDGGYGSDLLYEDVEGLTLYDEGDGKGYILVSSQGNNTVALYERGTEKYITSFKITDGEIDGVSETDGMHVSSVNFGEPFEKGVLIMQDGENQNTDNKPSTNFKYISWKNIIKKMKN